MSNRMVGRILEHMAQYQQISSQALEYLRGFSQGLATDQLSSPRVSSRV
ncbi:hypothetical protein [Mycobacterium canetti]|nr:hypothetical protein [Mycobacterium canetti]